MKRSSFMPATPLSMPTANAAAWSPRAITMKHSLEASHQRRSRTAAIIVAVHLMFGTVSFSLLEGWSLRDALYFSVQTLSTVGYGDLVPSHPASKLLCCVYILIGVSLISASLGAVLGRMQAAGEARMRSAIESPTTSEPLSAADKGTPSTSRHSQGSSRHSQCEGSSRWLRYQLGVATPAFFMYKSHGARHMQASAYTACTSASRGYASATCAIAVM